MNILLTSFFPSGYPIPKYDKATMMKSLFMLLLALFCVSQTQAFVPTSSPLNTQVWKQVEQATSQTPSSTILYGKKDARAQGNERKNKTERVRKTKDDVLEIEATVIESLPNAMFRCAIIDAPETQPPVLATISGKIRKNFVKILVGDKVLIELSPYDLTKGRITFRYR